jgi:hypothetical protein
LLRPLLHPPHTFIFVVEGGLLSLKATYGQFLPLFLGVNVHNVPNASAFVIDIALKKYLTENNL